jgi:hypothetical protein
MIVFFYVILSGLELNSEEILFRWLNFHVSNAGLVDTVMSVEENLKVRSGCVQ